MNTKAVVGILLGMMFILLFIVAIFSITISWPGSAPANNDVGNAKWGPRSFEVLSQGFILLAGVVAIILLLGSRKIKEAPP
jgi:ABC-type Fe3+ transport system permease subunit